MNIIELRKHLPTTVLTHEVLEAILRDSVSNINARIALMVKKGELIRLKRGVYVLGEDYRTVPVDPIAVANQLYAPSYVSFDYALSHYGLIPERVYDITSATMRLKKTFETALGRFTYKPISLSAYAIGVDWLYDKHNGGKLIATAEKALCDKIRADRGIGRLSRQKMADYLAYDLRIDMEILSALDAQLIGAIASAYRSPNLTTLAKLLDKRRHRA